MADAKKNVFVAKLARHAAATVMVGASAIPSSQAALAMDPPLNVQEFAVPHEKIISPAAHEASNPNGSITLRLPPAPPTQWDKKLEREFRALAIREATGTLSGQDEMRLEDLSYYREQLLSPQTVEETLLQIKRDRILARMESVLEDYVEFTETSNQKRTATNKTN